MEEGECDLCIINLPPEIIFYIFSYLDVVTLLKSVVSVCTSWKYLIESDSFWSSFKHLFIELTTKPVHVLKVIVKCVHLEHLKIIWVPHHRMKTKCSFFIYLSNLHHLKSLSFDRFTIDSHCAPALQHCLQHLPSLNTLVFKRSKLSLEISEIISRIKTLKSLAFMHCSHIKAQILLRTIKNSKKSLEYLNLDSQQSLQDSDITSLLLLCSSTLKSLNLEDVARSDSAYMYIRSCSHLCELRINCCVLTDHFLGLIKHLPLQQLELVNGNMFTSRGLKSLFTENSLSKLTFLVLQCNSVQDSTMEILSNNCHELMSLNVYAAKELTDKGIGYVLQKCSQLISLTLIKINLLEGLFLSEIHNHMESLKILQLYGCINIRSDQIKAFVYLNPNFVIKKSRLNGLELKPILLMSNKYQCKLNICENAFKKLS